VRRTPAASRCLWRAGFWRLVPYPPQRHENSAEDHDLIRDREEALGSQPAEDQRIDDRPNKTPCVAIPPDRGSGSARRGSRNRTTRRGPRRRSRLDCGQTVGQKPSSSCASGALRRAHTGSIARLEAPKGRSPLPALHLILEPRLRLHRRTNNRLCNDAGSEGQLVIGFCALLRCFLVISMRNFF
jgi:hypothetical protein